MSKILLFAALVWLTGSPIRALIVFLIILYFLDRRFLGLTPSIGKPIRRNRRLARLRQQLRAQPHDTRGKLEAARLLVEKKKYREAARYLEDILPVMDDSAEVLTELGLCRIKLGELEEGERLVLNGLELNPRVHYGEPYLRLGEVFASSQPDKAIRYLESFRELNTSSCEAYYRLGMLYKKLGREQEAKEAFRETVDIYRSLPKYKRRTERRWAILARFR
ncbi:tetratricopeptide repeat protein [Paenibacillus aurantius]|uniref:Tetratricopeptide repeat protein n=1 Tax=Paenibacillus aurantius TaxID=2918900 RepID=A0AA96LCS6_9BACL|nr:tetratricopeptide repeat protein [Paenibacillus aurantius]WNQ09830.1 tetratricopeptide repeat protein [Paenibacillus aurantius]